MKKSITLTPILIGFLAIAAFLLVLNYAIPAPTVSTSALSTNSVSTADWKTFTDTTSGFTLRYPPSWQNTNCHDTVGVLLSPEEIVCGANVQAVGVTLLPLSAGTPLTLARAQEALVSDPVATTLTIDQHKAYRVRGTTLAEPTITGQSTFVSDVTYVEIADDIWKITSTLPDDTSTVNAILASFHGEQDND